jgi:large subunit ribosomal protein L34
MSVKGFKKQNRKRNKTHGFLVRQATPGGKNMIKRRRQKGRAKVSA